MTTLYVTVLLTLGLSAFCSLLEAMVLSATTAEIETLKKTHKKQGKMLEKFKGDIEETSSAILSLNTVANTLGSVIIGGLTSELFGEGSLIYFSIGVTLGILIFSEVLPKNIGVLYRPDLMKHFIYPLAIVRFIMRPVSIFCQKMIRFALPTPKALDETSDEKEIILLAEKSAKTGQLSEEEKDMIANALSLDDVPAYKLMTPRTVILALEQDQTIENVFKEHPNLPFGRLPIYKKNIDHIVGIVRRRDLLHAKSNNKNNTKLYELMHPTIFIPETVSGADVLQHFLKKHQQMAVIVDEFGSTAGVITLENIFEHILGTEIFEKDDIAINMREHAMRKKELADRSRKGLE